MKLYLDSEGQRIAQGMSWREWMMWLERGWPIPETLRSCVIHAADSAKLAGFPGEAKELRAKTHNQSK